MIQFYVQAYQTSVPTMLVFGKCSYKTCWRRSLTSRVGPSYSTGLLLKPYVKVMTQKLEWWIILMVDCVTILLHFSTIRFPSANLRANGNTKVNDHTKSLWVGSKLLCATFES